ncbi:MAG: hypothetical protein AABZ60_01030 [Planctomycetota bacterium]
MEQKIKHFIDALSTPQISLSTLFLLFFIIMLMFLKQVTRGRFFWTFFSALIIGTLFSLTDPNFWLIATKPDNIPIGIMLFLAIFFTWLALKQGVDNDDRIAAGGIPREKMETPQKVMVWPDLVYIEFICLILATVFLVVWSIYIKAPLEEPASLAQTPNPSKAPWYFLGLQEMLVYFDPWLAGVVFPTLIITGLMAIPYIDVNPKGNGYYTFKERKFAIMTFCFGFLILWIALIVLGTFLRGPNWNFFGPFEFWDIHKVEALTNVNLSEYFWVRWLNKPLPDNMILRELPGFITLAGYFLFLPPLFAFVLMKNMYKKMGILRFNIMIIHFIIMLGLPIKMYLRWLFNLKYIIAIPEYFFNI